MNPKLEDLKEQIMNFDHTYEMSDDSGVWRQGRKEEEAIVEVTKNLSLADKERILAACKLEYNSWNPKNDFVNHPHKIIQNKIITLCGFSRKTSYKLSDLSEEYMERFIEKTFDRMTENGHLHLFDGPMEDHPKFEWVCEVAEENFEDKYGEIGFTEDGRSDV